MNDIFDGNVDPFFWSRCVTSTLETISCLSHILSTVKCDFEIFENSLIISLGKIFFNSFFEILEKCVHIFDFWVAYVSASFTIIVRNEFCSEWIVSFCVMLLEPDNFFFSYRINR